MFGVFRVKNHDFTPKNNFFSNCGGRRENFWGISCEKSRSYAKKNHNFSNFRGGALDPPLLYRFALFSTPTKSKWYFLKLVFPYKMLNVYSTW